MKKIRLRLLSASVFASLLVYLTERPSLVQAMMVSFLVMSIGLVEAQDTKTVQVIELQLSSGRDDLLPSPPIDVTVTVLSQKRLQGEVPRQRNTELSLQHLVVVGLNAQGQETSQTVILDPRILRAETSELSGQLTGSGLLYRKNVVFSVVIPDDPSVIALRIHQPRWTGTEFALDSIGEASLHEVESHD